MAAGRSLVVVGAHLFTADHNDPLRQFVVTRSFGGVLLVEASPPITHSLRAVVANMSIEEHDGRTRKQSLIHVSSAAVVPSDHNCRADNGTTPFFTLLASGAGLPHWSTQIGTLTHWGVASQLPFLRSMSRSHGDGSWTMERLHNSIVRHEVPCRTLRGELRRHTELPPPAAVLIDVEGFDCRIVADEDWCSSPLSKRYMLT